MNPAIPILTLIGTLALALAIWVAIKSFRYIYHRFIGKKLVAGKDVAIIQCETCNTFTMAMIPAALTPARVFMTSHYQENMDHYPGAELIPKGWDQ